MFNADRYQWVNIVIFCLLLQPQHYLQHLGRLWGETLFKISDREIVWFSISLNLCLGTSLIEEWRWLERSSHLSIEVLYSGVVLFHEVAGDELDGEGRLAHAAGPEHHHLELLHCVEDLPLELSRHHFFGISPSPLSLISSQGNMDFNPTSGDHTDPNLLEVLSWILRLTIFPITISLGLPRACWKAG